MSDNGPAPGPFPSGFSTRPHVLLHGRSNRSKHGGRLPRLQSIENRSRQPVLWVPPNAPESAISRLRPTTERRARTTTVYIPTAAQARRVCSRSASTLGVGQYAARSKPVFRGIRVPIEHDLTHGPQRGIGFQRMAAWPCGRTRPRPTAERRSMAVVRRYVHRAPGR